METNSSPTSADLGTTPKHIIPMCDLEEDSTENIPTPTSPEDADLERAYTMYREYYQPDIKYNNLADEKCYELPNSMYNNKKK